MAKRYDATTRRLIEMGPADWLRFLRVPVTHPEWVRMLDSRFRYNVVRIWERPVEEVLAAGLPVLPLAPVAAVRAEQLPEVLTAVARRLKEEASPQGMKLLWAATKVMMGLRCSEVNRNNSPERRARVLNS